MRIRTEEQISELLTEMVMRHASDEDLAVVIEYSATYVSGRNSLNKTFQEYGLHRYLSTCVPPLSEVSRIIATLLTIKNCAMDAEHMILFGDQLSRFYKDLEKYSVDLYFIETEIPWEEPKQAEDTVETDRYYETGTISGRSKLYELLEEIDKGDTV